MTQGASADSATAPAASFIHSLLMTLDLENLVIFCFIRVTFEIQSQAEVLVCLVLYGSLMSLSNALNRSIVYYSYEGLTI